MLFNSYSFFIFFPIVVLIYYLIPFKGKQYWLLFASYYFYMNWNAKYALLLLFSTAITFFSGLLIDYANKKYEDEKKKIRYKKIFVAICVTANLSILFLFKYLDFMLTTINRVLGVFGVAAGLKGFDLLLPVGISFYIFQALSYTIDVYRGEIYVERDFFRYALFVSFFPQLVAGPIERSKNLLKQLGVEHKFDILNVKMGLSLMLWGYFLKLVLAERLGTVVDLIYGNADNYTGVYILLATVLFAFQIYCDFAGYSTIAIGAAHVMGFRLMNNFESPYLAVSVADFWRRWHISLTSWFRDYLYIPLGGNRKGTVRKYVNIMIVFLLSGLWHGAAWTFVIWGGLNGLYQVIGGLLKPVREKLKKTIKINEQGLLHRMAKCLITFILVDFAWLFFRATSFGHAKKLIINMLCKLNVGAIKDGSIFHVFNGKSNLIVLVVALVILFVVDFLHVKNVKIREWIMSRNTIVRWMIYWAAMFFVLLFGFWGSGYDSTAFIYFQF